MKLQHYAIIFLIIILPFSIMCRNKMTNYNLVLKDQVRLNNVVDAATQDAVDILIELNDEFQMLYFGERFDITQNLAKESVKAFFRTLAINFNMPYVEGTTESYFSMYVPAVIIVGYDGFFIYSVDETPNGTFAYQMSPKIPYAYYDKDSGSLIHFTLGNDITLFTNNRVYQGELTCNYKSEVDEKYVVFMDALNGYVNDPDVILEYISELTTDMSVIVEALARLSAGASETLCPPFLLAGDEGAAIPLLQDYTKGDVQPSKFHEIRRKTIIDLINATLKEEINEHNTYAKMFGLNYGFSLPEIVDDEWRNSINDISVMSFIQGMPIGINSFYNNYALSGARIVQTDYYYGTNKESKMRYHAYDCPLIADFHISGDTVSTGVDNIFITREQAAISGYYPCTICKP